MHFQARLHSPGLLFIACGLFDRRGEEVVHRYSWGIQRNDKALLDYFFVQEHDPPLLCALDLPGVNVWDTLESVSNDHELYGLGGSLCIPVCSRSSQCCCRRLQAFLTTLGAVRTSPGRGEGLHLYTERSGHLVSNSSHLREASQLFQKLTRLSVMLSAHVISVCKLRWICP